MENYFMGGGAILLYLFAIIIVAKLSAVLIEKIFKW